MRVVPFLWRKYISFELWNVKKIRIKRIVTVHTLVAEKVFAAIVLLITGR
jgi:hypothetical protein